MVWCWSQCPSVEGNYLQTPDAFVTVVYHADHSVSHCHAPTPIHHPLMIQTAPHCEKNIIHRKKVSINIKMKIFKWIYRSTNAFRHFLIALSENFKFCCFWTKQSLLSSGKEWKYWWWLVSRGKMSDQECKEPIHLSPWVQGEVWRGEGAVAMCLTFPSLAGD